VDKVDKKSRLPLYCQLADIIKEKIATGQWTQHTRLPPERELCELYEVSRATVRQAMQDLEVNGYIYKEHGRGTFVKPAKIRQDLLVFYSFTEEMRKLGKTPSSQVVNFTVENCSGKIAKKMNLKPGEKVYKFTRLRLADGEPMMLETTYIPHEKFPGITGEKLEKNPLYEVLTNEHGVSLTMAEERFFPVLTREKEAEILQNLPHSPSMMIERLTYSGHLLVEYTVGIARGDKFEYRVVFE